MRRFIGLLCAITVFFSLLSNTLVYAGTAVYIDLDDQDYDVDAYHEKIWDIYNIYGEKIWKVISANKAFAFVNLVNDVGENPWMDFGLDIGTHYTGENLSEIRYTEILSNLMALMSLNTQDMIRNQAEADALKTASDYFLDVVEIGVEGISLYTAFGSSITKPMETIASTMGLTWDAADITLNSIENLEYVYYVLIDYEVYTEFLTVLAENVEDPALRSAAETMNSIVGKLLYCKMDTFVSQAGDTAKFTAKNVVLDTLLLDEVLANAQKYNLSSKEITVLNGLKNISIVQKVIDFSADVGLLISDIVGGFSDCMNRYSEMRAMCEIRSALLTEIEYSRSQIHSAEDIEEISYVYRLLRQVIYVTYRGEYCFHELVTKDGNIHSEIITKNGKDISFDDHFISITDKTTIILDWLDNIFPDKEHFKYNIASAEEPAPKPQRIAEYQNGVLVRECIFQYDNENNLTLRIDSRYENGVLDDQDTYSYNARGKLSSHTVFRDEGAYIFEDLYTYDEQGNLIAYQRADDFCPQEVWEYSSDGVLTCRRTWQYEGYYADYMYQYDTQGRLIQESCTDGLHDVTTYSYNEAGQLSGSFNTTIYGDMRGETQITYTYDARGHLVSETEVTSFGYDGYATTKITYTYDTIGRLVEKSTSGTFPYSGTETTRVTYCYEYAPFIVEKTYEGADSTLCQSLLSLSDMCAFSLSPNVAYETTQGLLTKVYDTDCVWYITWLEADNAGETKTEISAAESTTQSTPESFDISAYKDNYSASYTCPTYHVPGEMGLNIIEQDGNAWIYFSCWLDGVSSSVEDFSFIYQQGVNEYTVKGQRNGGTYILAFSFEGDYIKVTVTRVSDPYNVIPPGTYSLYP